MAASLGATGQNKKESDRFITITVTPFKRQCAKNETRFVVNMDGFDSRAKQCIEGVKPRQRTIATVESNLDEWKDNVAVSARKCRDYLVKLLKLARKSKEDSARISEITRNLIKELVTGNMNIEEFTAKLQTTIPLAPPGHEILPFLKKHLLSLRWSTNWLQKMSVDGIEVPPMITSSTNDLLSFGGDTSELPIPPGQPRIETLHCLDLLNQLASKTFDPTNAKQTRRIIFNGVLEWSEEDGEPQTKTQSVGFQIYKLDTDPHLKTTHWPLKLKLMFLPYRIASPLLEVFEQSRKIDFELQEMEAAEHLHSILAANHVALMSFPRRVKHIHAIFLMHDKIKHRLVGFMPERQRQLPHKLREILAGIEEKRNQTPEEEDNNNPWSHRFTSPPTIATGSSNLALVAGEEEPAVSITKCARFVNSMLKAATEKKDGQLDISYLDCLLQSVVDGRMTPQHFMSQLEVELEPEVEPFVIPFFKKSLALMRHTVATGRTSVETDSGIGAVEHRTDQYKPEDFFRSLEESVKEKGTDGLGKIRITNLVPTVNHSDLTDVFEGVGPLCGMVIMTPLRDESTRHADVVFKNKNDAFEAFLRFNGTPLDGREMRIQLMNDPADGPVITKKLTDGISIVSVGGTLEEVPKPEMFLAENTVEDSKNMLVAEKDAEALQKTNDVNVIDECVDVIKPMKMANCDSDQPPELVYSSDSDDEEYRYSAEMRDKDPEWMRRFEEVVRIRTLAPFLFATKYGSELWIRVLLTEGLLKKDWLQTNEFSSQELCDTTRLMVTVVESVFKTLVTSSLRGLNHSLLQSLENREEKDLIEVIPYIRENRLLFLLRQFDERTTKYLKGHEPDKITTALLYACHQYDTLLIELRKEDVLKKFDEKRQEDEENAAELKMKGNNKFKEKDYVQAIGFYTAALMRSPFNYILYANRSQAYLKKEGNMWLAVMDARRSIVLNKHFDKAYIRCAYAWQELHKYDEALSVLNDASALGLDPVVILPYINKIKRMKGGENYPPSTGVPTAISTHGSETTVLKEQNENIEVTRVQKVKNEKIAETGNATKPETLPKKSKETTLKELSDDLKNHTREGSQSLLAQNFSTAITEYHIALDLVKTLAQKSKNVSVNEQTILKYALSCANMESGSKPEVQDAVRLLEDIRDKQGNRPFPLVYYGLCRAYFLQTRFEEASAMLQLGLKKTNQLKKLSFPGVPKEIAQSGSQSAFKDALRTYMKQCEDPPRPDATCRMDDQALHTRAAIYIADPEFKGYVRVKCVSLCIIDYHPDCYKKLASSRVKKADKELLNTPCFTPDCGSNICLIIMFDSEGAEKRKVEPKEKLVNNPKKAEEMTKAKLPSSKVAAGQTVDRKHRKKQRRLVSQNTVPEEEEESQQGGVASTDQSQQAQSAPVPSEEEIAMFATVLKKEEDNDGNQATRGAKAKKKKDKAKKVMSLGEFVGNQEDSEPCQWESNQFEDLASDYVPHDAAMGIDDFEVPYTRQYPVLDHSAPFVVPEYMRAKISAFEQTHETSPVSGDVYRPQISAGSTHSGSSNRLDQLDELEPIEGANLPPVAPDESVIKEFLYSYFAGVLEFGPIQIEDPMLTQHLQQFPTSAHAVIAKSGGLPSMLSQNNSNFVVTGNYISLRRDLLKAENLNLESKKPPTIEKMPSGTSTKVTKPRKQLEIPTIFDTPMPDDDQMSEQSWTGSETSYLSETSSSKSESRFRHEGTPSRLAQRPQDASKLSYCDMAALPDNSKSPIKDTKNSPRLSKNRLDRDISGGSLDSGSGSLFDLPHMKRNGCGDAIGTRTNQVSPVCPPSPHKDIIVHKINKPDLPTGAGDLRAVSPNKGSSKLAFSPLEDKVKCESASPVTGVKTVSPGIIGEKRHESTNSSDEVRTVLPNSPQKQAEPENASPNIGVGRGDTKQPTGIVAPVPKSLYFDGSNITQLPPSPTKQSPPGGKVHTTTVLQGPFMGSRIIATSRGVNTDPILLDWSEVEAVMSRVEIDKIEMEARLQAQIAAQLESDKATRRELVQEQSEQLEHLVAKMMAQEETCRGLQKENGTLEASNAAQQQTIVQLQGHIAEMESAFKSRQDAEMKVSLLEKQMTELKHLLETNRKERAQENSEHENEMKALSEKYGMDLLRAERAEINVLKYKLQRSMENFAKSTATAEREKNVYLEYINSMEVEGNRAPPELIGVYQNWSRILNDITTKQQLCKVTFEEQIQKIKRGERLDDLPTLEVVDPPAVPQRPANDSANKGRRGSGSGPPAAPEKPALGSGPGAIGPNLSTRGHSSSTLRNQSGFLGPPPSNINRTVMRSAFKREPQKKNSFEKIMQSLSSMFPNYRGTDIKQYILRLRESRGGTLTGMNLQQIVARVAELIMDHMQHMAGSMQAGQPNIWATRKVIPTPTVTDEEIFEEEEDPCVICHEELTFQSLLTVECGHRFHNQCIRRWMQEQSTCPTCRKHFLLPEDFPALA